MLIRFTQQSSKVKQLADAISQAISCRDYAPGQALPSINSLSRQHHVSRDTVFKAFMALKKMGVVDSTPAKGYYVSNAVVNVLLLLDTYSPFKYELHNALTLSLPKNYKVELYFHQYSEENFNRIVTESIGRYNLYLIMNYRNDVYSEVLDRIDSSKLLLLDFGKFEKKHLAYVCQGFDSTLYDCLSQGQHLFAKYNKIRFVFPDGSEHPDSCLPYFEKFCRDFGFPCEVSRTVGTIEEGTAYLLVNHSHLVDIVKDLRGRGLQLGQDVGVVVINDEPMFEIIGAGITAISTDFQAMGRIASEFIKTRRRLQVYVPTQLLIRSSL